MTATSASRPPTAVRHDRTLDVNGVIGDNAPYAAWHAQTLFVGRGRKPSRSGFECAVAADSEVIVSDDSDLLRLGNFRGIDITKASDLIGRLERKI